MYCVSRHTVQFLVHTDSCSRKIKQTVAYFSFLSDESFTGQSFLLLDSASIKELGIKMSGRLQLNKLIKEASISIEPEDNGVLDEVRLSHVNYFIGIHKNNILPTLLQGRVVVPPASTLIVNNFSESSPTGGTNIRVQVRGVCVYTGGTSTSGVQVRGVCVYTGGTSTSGVQVRGVCVHWGDQH